MNRLILIPLLTIVLFASGSAVGQLSNIPSPLAALQAALKQVEDATTAEQKLAALEKALAAEQTLPLQRNEAARAELRAQIKGRLAGALLSAHSPILAADAARAIDLMREPLVTLDTQKHRPLWWKMHAIVAAAEMARRDGDRETNLTNTTAAAEIALKGLSAGLDPEWQGMQILLAEAYLERRTGNRNENIAHATAALWKMLDIDFPSSDLQSTRDYFRDVEDKGLLHADWLSHLRRVIETLDAALNSDASKADAQIRGRLSLALGSAILVPKHIFAPGWRLDVDHAKQALQVARSVLDVKSYPSEHIRAALLLGSTLAAQGDWASAEGVLTTAWRVRGEHIASLTANQEDVAWLLETEEVDQLYAVSAAHRASAWEGFARAEIARARYDASHLKRAARDPGFGSNAQAVVDAAQRSDEKLAGIPSSGRKTQDLASGLDATVVTLSVSSEGGAVYVVNAKRTVVHFDPNLRHAALAPIVNSGNAMPLDEDTSWREAYIMGAAARTRERLNSGDPASAAPNNIDLDAVWERAIERVGDRLWSLFGRTIVEALREAGVSEGGRVLWIPEGDLGLIPVGLARETATGKRFMELYEITTIPDLSAYLTAKRAGLGRKTRITSLTGLFNPRGDLPSAEAEAVLVKAAGLPGGVRKLPPGSTGEQILANLRPEPVWHFATHGSFAIADGLASGLVLGADKNGIQQMLTARDLLSLRRAVTPQLVVLSACDTGQKDIMLRIGLAGAFLDAGAAGVVATLWAVNDLSTALLMAKFYSGLTSGGLSPPAALRAAQIWLRDSTGAELLEFVENLQTSDLSGSERNVLAQIIAEIEKHIDEQPFAHPRYWGGFFYTGA